MVNKNKGATFILSAQSHSLPTRGAEKHSGHTAPLTQWENKKDLQIKANCQTLFCLTSNDLCLGRGHWHSLHTHFLHPHISTHICEFLLFQIVRSWYVLGATQTKRDQGHGFLQLVALGVPSLSLPLSHMGSSSWSLEHKNLGELC